MSSSTVDTPARRLSPLWTIGFAVGLGVLAVILFLRGYEFYHLSTMNRPTHEDYRVLSATGDTGLGYGFIGTLLIFLNLLYLVRRRFARLPLGSLRVWLEIHVFTGLAGSMLILFHSAFQGMAWPRSRRSPSRWWLLPVLLGATWWVSLQSPTKAVC